MPKDNASNQQVAIGILAKLGLRVDVKAHGAEALRMLLTARAGAALDGARIDGRDRVCLPSGQRSRLARRMAW